MKKYCIIPFYKGRREKKMETIHSFFLSLSFNSLVLSQRKRERVEGCTT
jgi:hypothetical protein